MKKLIEKLNDFITMCNASWGEIFIDHYGDCYIRLETCMDIDLVMEKFESVFGFNDGYQIADQCGVFDIITPWTDEDFIK